MNGHEYLPHQVHLDRLTSLQNPRGGRICDGGQARELLGLEANPDKLVKLFRYTDDQGNEKFFADSVAHFIKKGNYSVSDLLKVAELVDHAGNDIIRSSNEFHDFMEIKGSIGSAQALARINDSEGLTVYRHDDKKWMGFNGFASITGALTIGATAAAVQELVDIRNDADTSVFRTPRDINRFFEHEGTPDYARDILTLRDHQAQQIFNEFSIALFKEYGGTIKYAQSITALQDTEGQTVFSDGNDIVNFLIKEHGQQRNTPTHRSIHTAKKVIELTDNNGGTVFRDGKDIAVALQATKDNIDSIYPYVQISDASGNTCFNGEEIALLLESKVPVEYATSLARQGLNAHTIMYYHKMEFPEDQTDFSNSGNPKALIIYPTDDPKQILSHAFRNQATFDVLKNISGTYDVKLRAISSVEEMLTELDAADDAHYLILAGHGSRTGITFGKRESKYGRNSGSPKLTADHTQIRNRLARLPSLSHIWLDSCSTGEGGESEDNMVNFVADCAPDVMVTGPTAVTGAHLTDMQQMDPSELRLYSLYDYKDCTYSRRVAKQNTGSYQNFE